MSSWNPAGWSDPHPQQPGHGPPVGYGQQPGHTYGPQDYPFGGYPDVAGYPAAPPLEPYAQVGGQPGGHPGGQGQPATMGNRLLAKLIDALIIAVPFALLILWTQPANSSTPETWIYVVAIAAQLAYETYYVGVRGATIGKRMRGIRVVDEQSASLLGPRRAFVRSLVQALSNFALYAGYWSPFLDRPKLRGWHDKAAGDVVVGGR